VLIFTVVCVCVSLSGLGISCVAPPTPPPSALTISRGNKTHSLFSHAKADHTGDRPKNPRHIYAHPLNPAICLFLHSHCTCAIYSLRVVGEAISSVLPEFASAALTHRSQTQRSCQMRWTTIAKLVLPSEGLVRRSMSDGFFFAAIFSCFRLTLARCDLSAILLFWLTHI